MWSEMMRRHTLLLILTMVMTTLAFDINDLNHSKQWKRLWSDLFHDYDKYSLPSPHSTTVEMLPFALHHFDMHEAEHYLEVHGWYKWEWNDPRLAWNQTVFSEISVLRIPARKVWKPDISIYNSVDGLNFDNHGDVNVLVYPDGKILYIPPSILKTTCITNMRYWPHDIQSCKIKHGSWVHDGNTINVTIQDDQFDMSDFAHTTEWRLESHEVRRHVTYYPCCEEPYLDITFELLIKRNAPALVYTFKIPAIGLSFLSLFVFLLPPAAGEKLLLSSLLLLMDQQFLIHTVDIIQHSPSDIPIVIRLVSEQLYLVLISLIVSVVTLRMSRPPHGEPLSHCIMAPLRALAPFLLLGKYSNVNYHPVHEVELTDSTPTTFPVDAKSKKEPGDWILIAALVDRILFIVYFIIVMENLIEYASLL